MLPASSGQKPASNHRGEALVLVEPGRRSKVATIADGSSQTNLIRRSLPIALAARKSVCNVIEALPGTKKRSNAARLVCIRRAISALLIFSVFIVCCIWNAIASLIAIARASSRMLSSQRRSSSDDPMFRFRLGTSQSSSVPKGECKLSCRRPTFGRLSSDRVPA